MFKQVIKDIQAKTEGCLGVVIMGTDGIPVEQIWQPEGMDANLDVAVAEFTSLLRNAMRTSSDLGLERLREMSVLSDTAYFVMRLINDEYFLVVVLKPDGNLGRARFELRCAELVLEKEFAF